MSVSEWVCHTKRVERSTDRNLPPMFTKLATKVDSQEMWLPIVFGGGDPKYFRLPCTPKPPFGENLQLKPMESISASFLTTERSLAMRILSVRPSMPVCQTRGL